MFASSAMSSSSLYSVPGHRDDASDFIYDSYAHASLIFP